MGSEVCLMMGLSRKGKWLVGCDWLILGIGGFGVWEFGLCLVCVDLYDVLDFCIGLVVRVRSGEDILFLIE